MAVCNKGITQLVFLNCDTAVLIRVLERLGLEAVSRRFLERLVRSHLGLESLKKMEQG